MPQAPTPFTADDLAQALRQAVADALAAAPRFDPPPNLDLAVLALPPGAPPVGANVLFSREFPEGWITPIAPGAGPVQGLQFLADVREGPEGTSVAWAPGSDWRQRPADGWRPLAGSGPRRFIAPYPASLLKLMVAVGVGHLVDTGRAHWDEPWPHGPAQGALAPTVAQWAQPMLETSSNEATSALVALLHARGLIVRRGWRPGSAEGDADAGEETANGLHTLFEGNGLHTLRLANTRPDGGWFNRSGAGVGQLQMTAWDTVRLLWRLSEPLPATPGEATDRPKARAGAKADATADAKADAEPGAQPGVHPRAVPDPALGPDTIAPPAPWLPPGTPPLLQADSRARLWQWLRGQALHEVLSSSLVAGVPGWQPGIPALLPARWLRSDGSALAAGRVWPGDLRPQQAQAQVCFAHKTGTTASYVSDAGRVLPLPGPDGTPGPGRRYLIALISTLGNRHAPHPDLATDWALPRIGAAVDAWLKARLG